MATKRSGCALAASANQKMIPARYMGYIKKINFEDQHKVYNFEERVQAFNFGDFERMLSKAGMRIENTFGNYSLDDFDHSTSDRLILICKKA